MSDFTVIEKSGYEAGFVDGHISGVMVAGDGMVYFEVGEQTCRSCLSFPQIEFVKEGLYVRAYLDRQSCIEMRLGNSTIGTVFLMKPFPVIRHPETNFSV